jgi:hypothetical protein
MTCRKARGFIQPAAAPSANVADDGVAVSLLVSRVTWLERVLPVPSTLGACVLRLVYTSRFGAAVRSPCW